MGRGGYKLFPTPGFLTGVGRLVDFGGALNHRNMSVTGREADARALRSDWEVVGRDIDTAMSEHRRDGDHTE
jgi:hypothetical protein